VFLRINHDNNHHLYSLWLQVIGPTASPLLARGPAILAGSLCVIVAALLAGRHSRIAGIVAAVLFAVSPTLVVFGSEARGYAMMLLAALLLLLLVDDALEGHVVRGARWWIALLALLGMLSHMTMAAPIGLATLWFYRERRAAAGPSAALPETLRLLGPALVATAAAVAFVFTAAALSPTGMRLGGYVPFAAAHYAAALNDLALWSAGLGSPWPWLVPALVGTCALLIVVRRPDWLGPRGRLYALLILGIPLGVAVLRPGNSEFARYYLASTLGLLLLLSDWIGRGLSESRPMRAAAAMLLVTLVGVSLYGDSLLIKAARGRPSGAVADMAALSPQGARVAFAQPQLKAVVALASARRGYAARFAGGCAPADFMIAAPSRWRPAPRTVERCGVLMEAIDSSSSIPLTGDSWVLYRPKTLQSLKAADSGRPPAAMNRRLSGRAGVAQG
jgi:hypothetical protein